MQSPTPIQRNKEHKNPQKVQGQGPIQIFICSCRKEYSSFPALYLHNKTKHGITLRIQEKQNMSRRTAWSGMKKKLIYQFREESQEDESQKPQIRNKKLHNNKAENKKTEELNNESAPQVAQILQQFNLERRTQFPLAEDKQLSQLLKEQFLNCILKSKGLIYKMESQTSIIQVQAIPCNLPHLFNYFILEHQPNSRASGLPVQKTVDFMLSLSQWLYSKGISNVLAEKNQ